VFLALMKEWFDFMPNVILDKSFDFAVKIVKLADLIREQKQFELANQILRSGTSIGANVQEAQRAESDKDFVSKMSVASKEANETSYWLRLLRAANIISDETFDTLNADANEIIRLLISIIKSKQANMRKEQTNNNNQPFK